MKKNGFGADFVIFSDKDGTLDLNDSHLNLYLTNILKNNGQLVVTTGRSAEILKDTLKKQGIRIPRYIISDNGAVITDTIKDEIIFKKVIPHDSIIEIVGKLVQTGGNANHIRYFDGKKIYAHDTEQIRDWYAPKNVPIEYVSNVLEGMKKRKDITKVMLSGTEEQIQEINQFIPQNYNFWTDVFKQIYPEKEAHMLTFFDNSVNKGNAIKEFTQLMRVKKYACIGNGSNDISMFQQAIDDGMQVIVIREEGNTELIQQVQEYAKRKHREVTVVNDPRALANKSIGKMSERMMTSRDCSSSFREGLKVASKGYTPQSKSSTYNTSNKNILYR